MNNIDKKFPVEKDQIHWLTNSNDNIGIRVLGSGNTLYYQKNDNWFTCEMSAVTAIIGVLGIKQWNNGEKISKEEKKEILENIKILYQEYYGKLPTLKK